VDGEDEGVPRARLVVERVDEQALESQPVAGLVGDDLLAGELDSSSQGLESVTRSGEPRPAKR
jgi:hypothetical protein